MIENGKQPVEELTKELGKCTVGTKIDGKTNGTGIIVSEDGLMILTCYHVIGKRETKTPYSDDIKVFLSGQIEGPEMPVELDQEKSDPNLDIAFLKLSEKINNSSVAKLSDIGGNLGDEHSLDLHQFYSIGFPKAHLSRIGLAAFGTIMRKTTLLELPALQLNSNQILKGISGSALLDLRLGRVVGMISTHYKRDDQPNLSYAIPIESIIKAYPGIKDTNRGLSKIVKFLMLCQLRENDSRGYGRIDTLYVPPDKFEYSEYASSGKICTSIVNFEDIKKSLRERKVLMLVGAKEYGKSFTAMRILWDLYNQYGYQPKCLEESDSSRLAEISDKLGSRQAYYFDDPFGKYEYQHNNELSRNFSNILAKFRNASDSLLIITSRQDIYDEFLRKSAAEIREQPARLDLKHHPYSAEKRKEMLRRWSGYVGCKWLHENQVAYRLFDSLNDDSCLPTPLNIKDFAYESGNETEINMLLKIMTDKSRETSKVFALDIRDKMTPDHILFLSFPLIASSFNRHYVEKKYNQLKPWVRQAIYGKSMADFSSLLQSFQRDKINIDNQDRLSFSHPSYYQSSHIILDDNEPTNAKTIILKVLLEIISQQEELELLLLEENDTLDGYYNIVKLLVQYYEQLEPRPRDLLFRLAENRQISPWVAYSIIQNFSKLDAYPDLRSQLLMKLAEDTGITEFVTQAILLNYSKLDAYPEVQRIVFDMAEKDKAEAWKVASLVIYCFSIVDAYFDANPAVKGILLNISDDKIGRRSEDSEKSYTCRQASNYIDSIIRNLSKLDAYPDLRNKLLTKLAEDKDAAGELAHSIRYKFSKFDAYPDLRNKLLTKLAEDKDAAGMTAQSIIDNYSRLDAYPEVQGLVFKIAADKYIFRWADYNMAQSIIDNYSRLDAYPEVQKLLFKIAEEDAWLVGRMVFDTFSKLDAYPDVQKLLFKIGKHRRSIDNLALSEMIWSIMTNLSKLDAYPDLRNQLLTELAEDKNAAYWLAFNIILLFPNLDAYPDIQELLFKIAENRDTPKIDDVIIENLSRLDAYPKVKIDLISNHLAKFSWRMARLADKLVSKLRSETKSRDHMLICLNDLIFFHRINRALFEKTSSSFSVDPAHEQLLRDIISSITNRLTVFFDPLKIQNFENLLSKAKLITDIDKIVNYDAESQTSFNDFCKWLNELNAKDDELFLDLQLYAMVLDYETNKFYRNYRYSNKEIIDEKLREKEIEIHNVLKMCEKYEDYIHLLKHDNAIKDE